MPKVEQVTPYGTGVEKKKEVEQMFDNIAHQYDFLNHLLSMGIDNLWRRTSRKTLAKYQPKVIMDLASGTGDFAFELLKLNPEKIVAADLSEEMLSFGRVKSKKRGTEKVISFEKVDSENMPYEDNTFDAITVGFGVRNFGNIQRGLDEMYRVLKPGGVALVLELSSPTVFPVKQFFYLYFHYVCPIIGRWFSKDHRAYSYLPESVASFPQGEKFLNLMSNSGFKATRCRRLTFGISTMYLGEKP